MRYLVLLLFVFVSKSYSQSDFGSSFNPTYGIVQANIPQDYYQEADGKSSEQLKESLYQIISKHSGQSFEKVTENSDRDYWMKANEAKDYGMVDEVLDNDSK